MNNRKDLGEHENKKKTYFESYEEIKLLVSAKLVQSYCGQK
jgi:hypothetical protein